ncbi:hypothetical protein GCM10020001_038990 [Nonomuraea salmonea]
MGGIFLGEGDEGLAADPQVLDLLAELAQPRGEHVDLRLGLLDLAGQGLLAGVDPVQEPGTRVGRPGVGPDHAHRHDGDAPRVRRRDITSVIAQYTRASELAGRCS